MKIDKSLLSGSTALLVLSLLSESDKYGYQMISDLALRSEQVFEFKEGTLYPVLHALEKEGALRSYEKEVRPDAAVLFDYGQGAQAPCRKKGTMGAFCARC